MGLMSHHAVIRVDQSWLCGQQGEFMMNKFFPDLIPNWPRYVRGPKKGKMKGFIRYRRVERGGWVRTGPGYYGERSEGYVERRVGRIIRAELVLPEWRGESKVYAEATLLGSGDEWRREFTESLTEGAV